MAKTARVSVPKEHGDEITVRFGGQPKKTYKVTDGHVTVEAENVDRFLDHFEGSKVVEDEKHVAKSDSK